MSRGLLESKTPIFAQSKQQYVFFFIAAVFRDLFREIASFLHL